VEKFPQGSYPLRKPLYHWRHTLLVDLETEIKDMPLDDVSHYRFWTFNGGVPGPFVRCRVGDILDVRLQNDDPTGLLHNIDMHAVEGPGGGAPVLTAELSHVRKAHFKVMHPVCEWHVRFAVGGA